MQTTSRSTGAVPGRISRRSSRAAPSGGKCNADYYEKGDDGQVPRGTGLKFTPTYKKGRIAHVAPLTKNVFGATSSNTLNFSETGQ
jgi:hypothetical protein